MSQGRGTALWHSAGAHAVAGSWRPTSSSSSLLLLLLLLLLLAGRSAAPPAAAPAVWCKVRRRGARREAREPRARRGPARRRAGEAVRGEGRARVEVRQRRRRRPPAVGRWVRWAGVGAAWEVDVRWGRPGLRGWPAACAAGCPATCSGALLLLLPGLLGALQAAHGVAAGGGAGAGGAAAASFRRDGAPPAGLPRKDPRPAPCAALTYRTQRGPPRRRRRRPRPAG